MPFAPDEIGWDHSCGAGPVGHWHGWFQVRVRAGALRRLGLLPGQPTSGITGPASPGWWHAAAERAARRTGT